MTKVVVCEWCHRVVEFGADSPVLGIVVDFTVCDTCAEKHWLETEKNLLKTNE